MISDKTVKPMSEATAKIPKSTPVISVENWPPDPEDITEQNIQQWIEQAAFGAGLSESTASTYFRALRDHFRKNPDLFELSEAARYKFMCLHLMVMHAKLEEKLVEILENQAHPPPISLE